MRDTVSASDVYKRQVIFLTAGDKVFEDAMIIESNQLIVDESHLEQERIHILKNKDCIHINETYQSNYIYRDSFIKEGSCYATVTTIPNKLLYDVTHNNHFKYQKDEFFC